MKRFGCGVVLMLVVGLRVVGAEIGFVERFALATDRAAALQELTPGTDEYYYYHALHAQNRGEYQRVEQLLKEWQGERKKALPKMGQEIEYRQALLQYEKQPKATVDKLREWLHLDLTLEKRSQEKIVALPTVLDQRVISEKAILQQIRDEGLLVDGVNQAGLKFMARQQLSKGELQRVVEGLERPDVPNMVGLVLRHLQESEGARESISKQPLFQKLTTAQLDEVLKRRPQLRSDRQFVNFYLAKLVPDCESDVTYDVATREAYLERLWNFTAELPPTFNSLKANILYNRLQHDLSCDRMDRARFISYISLPRSVPYIGARVREKLGVAEHTVRFGELFDSVQLPHIPYDEPLVRRYLLEYLKDAKDVKEFESWLDIEYLNKLLAEAKIVNGVGEPQKWATLLSPEEYKRIRERVDLEFSETNPAIVGIDDAVALEVFVKNVESLMVKVYELNTINYYRESGKPLNLALNLDGLMAGWEEQHKYSERAELRVKRRIELPLIKARGVYVVELIGNGKSSRALVQKGGVNVLQRVTAAGHTFTVFDERGQRVDDAVAWLGGREFKVGKGGNITVPYSSGKVVKEERLIVGVGNFATVVSFKHQRESYQLEMGAYIEREALIRGNTVGVALRPVLRVNGRAAPIELLEEAHLEIELVDTHETVMLRSYPNVTLHDDRESVLEFKVPDDLVSVSVTLCGKVQNIALNKREELEDSATFNLNGLECQAQTRALHIRASAKGYALEVRGKNGEAVPEVAVKVELLHKYLKNYRVEAVLKSDSNGCIDLGELQDVVNISATAKGCEELSWQVPRDECDSPAVLHGVEGEVLRMAVADASKMPSLLETRNGAFTRDWREALTVAGGLLEIKGLPVGDYSLLPEGAAEAITVRITRGVAHAGVARSEGRALELQPLPPLGIAAIVEKGDRVEISLVNASNYTRVHLLATHYLPTYSVSARLGVTMANPLLQQPWQPKLTVYESGRDIGDEYRYIFERRSARKFPGMLLERPGLLLTPWALRETDAARERLAQAGAYRDVALPTAAAAPAAPRMQAARRMKVAEGEVSMEGFATVDYLKQPGMARYNLKPGGGGKIVVPRTELQGYALLRVVAVDPLSTVVAHQRLSYSAPQRRELRQTVAPKAGLLSEQKEIVLLQVGDVVEVADTNTTQIEIYDSVAKLLRLYSALNPDETLAEFAFIGGWGGLDEASKERLYGRYACHELNLFLYFKDAPFFEAKIAPLLADKRDKTFMDHWLLGSDLRPWLEPWRLATLNSAERALLAKGVGAASHSLARDTLDRAELNPPQPEEYLRRFDTALQGSAPTEAAVLEALSTSASPASMIGEMMVASVASSPLRASSGEGVTPQALAKMAPKRVAEVDGAVAAKPTEEKREVFDKEEVLRERQAARPFYSKLEKTREWAENNYWQQPLAAQSSKLIKANQFWAEFAAHDGRTPFITKSFIWATSNFSEMMLALAVLQVPLSEREHQIERLEKGYRITAAAPLMVCRRELKPVDRGAGEERKDQILVAESFFRAYDREDFVGGARRERRVTGEFLSQVVYGGCVVITNPSDTERRVNALLRIPPGAIPVEVGFYTRGAHLRLEPFSTRLLDYHFYFPEVGQFRCEPLTVTSAGQLVGATTGFDFKVVATLASEDTNSWLWVAHSGSEKQVIEYLEETNLYRTPLDEISWRMQHKGFCKKVLGLLRKRNFYSEELWGYGFKHYDMQAVKEYLEHSKLAEKCGMWIESPLLTIKPVERGLYQHLEYAPLVNPRTHIVGAERKIQNSAFLRQYQSFMRLLSYKSELSAEDMLALTVYLLLQERVEEALTWFARIEREQVAERMQYDYLAAWLALAQQRLPEAERLVQEYAQVKVEPWVGRFAQLADLLTEVSGGVREVGQEAREGTAAHLARQQRINAMTASEPALEMTVEGSVVVLEVQNVREVVLNYYPMDLELLFSRTPFLREGAAHYSYIQPVAVRRVAAAGVGVVRVELPDDFKQRNVMIEALAGGVRRTQVCYANAMRVALMESYGQLTVSEEANGKPVVGAYVKVYAQMADGKVSFFKDGYTDLRGRFDYASVNSDEFATAQRFAILVMSDALGATVREAAPPKE